MSSNKVTAAYVADVAASAPAQVRFRKFNGIQVRGGASAFASYVSFPASYPREKVNVVRATIRLTQSAALAGTGNVTVRPVPKAVPYSSLSWTNQPGGYGTITKVTKSRSTAGQVWDFDVTRQIQDMVDGLPNYGFHVSATETDASLVFWATGPKAPTLEVEWTSAPLQPRSLAPSGGRAASEPQPTLRWSWFDVAGATDMKAYQVQLSTSPTFATVMWDSGEVLSNHCNANLSALGAPALTNGQTMYWRVRNEDGGSLWSDWSVPAQMTYRPLPTVAVISPPEGSVTDDLTPRFNWSYSSASPQARWEVLLYQLDLQGRETFLASSGAQSGTATSWSPPFPLKSEGQPYRWEIRAWDSYAREQTPGVNVYGVATAKFSARGTATVAAPKSISYLRNNPYPHVTITWARDVQPDEWLIRSEIGNVTKFPGNLYYNTASKTWTVDVTPVPPRVPSMVHVYPVANGKLGAPASVEVRPHPTGTWVYSTDGVHKLPIVDEEIDLSLDENVAYHQVLGAKQVTPVIQGKNGYSGNIKGNVFSFNGMTNSHRDWSAELRWFKDHEGEELWLFWGTRVFKIVMTDLSWGDRDEGEGNLMWAVQFRADQVGSDFGAVNQWAV